MRANITATPVSLNATIARIKASLRIVNDEDTLSRPIDCIRCRDLGVIEMTGGTYELHGDPTHRRRGRRVEATPESPVFVRCECVKRQAAAQEPARKVFKAS